MNKYILLVIFSVVCLFHISSQSSVFDSIEDFTIQNISGVPFALGETIDSISARLQEDLDIKLEYEHPLKNEFDLFRWKVFVNVEAFFHRGDKRLRRIVIYNPAYSLIENNLGVQSSVAEIVAFYGTPNFEHSVGSERRLVYRVPESQILHTVPENGGWLQDSYRLAFIVPANSPLVDGSPLISRAVLTVE